MQSERASESTVPTAVLPDATSEAGGKALQFVDELLTEQEMEEVKHDLTEMARLRREAEASSASLRLS